MDHPLQAPDALIRPWRTAAFVAGSVALVELLLLLVIAGGALARTVSHSVQLAATHQVEGSTSTITTKHVTRKPASIPAAKLSRDHTKVLVLNGNGRQGAAAVEAARVRHHGYRIGGVANAPRSDYTRSIVMFRPRYAGEGHRLGHDLRISVVSPLDGMRVRQLHGAHLVLILGG